MPALAEIGENKKYTRSSGASLSGISLRSGHSSVASSAAASTASKIRRYLDASINAVRACNSQLSSLGEDYSVDELRSELRRVCESCTPVQSRADEFSIQALKSLARELRLIAEFCGSLSEEKQAQLRYELTSVVGIAESIEEIVGAKTATVSIAGSYGQQAQLETRNRLTAVEDSLGQIKDLLVQSRDVSMADPSGTRVDVHRGIDPATEIIPYIPAANGRDRHDQKAGADQAPWHGQMVYYAPSGGVHGSNGHTPYGPGGPVPISLTLNNHLSNDARAAAAARQSAHQEATLVSKVKSYVRAAMGSPLATAAIAAVATLLLHNRLPIVQGIAPGRRRGAAEEGARAAQAKAAASVDAFEDCSEAMREWREYARRSKGPFSSIPEPDSSRCDIRALRRQLQGLGPDQQP